MKLLTIILTINLCSTLFAQKYEVELVLRNHASSSDICPIIYDEGIVFMSNEKNEYLRTVKDETNNYPYHLFYQKLDSNKTIGKRVAFAEEISTLFNDGPVSSFDSEKKILFSKNTNSNTIRKNKTRTMGLFFSEKNGETWSEPVPFEHNSFEYNITHPAINESGTLIIFSSAKKSGFGGMDLYYSEFKNGKWQYPINLGEKVNTSGDEVYPTIVNNNIYYATNGKNDSTGLDIWSVNFTGNSVNGNPILLDTTLNSSYDDFGITFRKDNKSGYLTSNRNGSDQIYHFTKTLPNLDNCPLQKKISYCYLIEEHNMLDESGMPLKFTWDLGDGTKQDGYRIKHCYDTLGSYTATLNIVDTITGDIFHEVSQVSINIEAGNMPRIVIEDTVFRNELTTFKSNLSYLSEPKEEIYWQVNNSDKIIGESFQDRFKKEDSLNIKLGVIDSNGDLTCVTKVIPVVDIGEKLAKVSSNLATQEIKPSAQLKSTESYSVQILTSKEKVNTNDKRFSDVDYPVIETFLELDNLNKYSVGQSKKIDELYYLYKEMIALGFDAELIKVEITEVALKNTESLMKVYFGKDDAEITTFNLQNIKKFASNLSPNTLLKVSGFADPEGDTEMNKKLSLKRALSVQKELVKLGINKSSIKVVAEGEIASENRGIESLKMLRKVEIQIIP